MSQIQIYTQMLPGNMCDAGWTNQKDAAEALAEYTLRIWAGDVAPFIAAGHDIDIDIDVLHDTCGTSLEPSVTSADPTKEEDNLDIVERIKNALTDKQTILDRFVNSEEASKL